jgi:hypothetical protein
MAATRPTSPLLLILRHFQAILIRRFSRPEHGYTWSMRWVSVLLLVLAADVSAAADRQWQTGKWADVGVTRSPLIGDPRSSSPGALPYRSTTPEVGRYSIETADSRYTLEDVVPLGGPGSFDLAVKIGESVTFAVNKSTVYIKGDGTEYRLKKQALHTHPS